MFKYVNIPVFIISFAVGVLFVYLYQEDKRTVFVYPTPESVDLLEYRDATGNCFHFKQTQVTCPKESEIAKMPAQ